MSTQLATTRRFNVDEYYRMVDAGILGPHERVELIEGEIIQMASIGSRHGGVVKRLTRLFTSGLGDAVLVQVQDPVRPAETIEVYREPRAAGYRDVTTHRRGDVLHPLAFPDLDVPVYAILR